jgi:hypothetical protein
MAETVLEEDADGVRQPPKFAPSRPGQRSQIGHPAGTPG